MPEKGTMARKIFRIKYPKLVILISTIILAYALFMGRNFEPMHAVFVSAGYLGVFAAGCLYAYGFTAAPAAAILLILAEGKNILFAAFIGGAGALLGDLAIFFLIKQLFSDEIKKLHREKLIRFLEREEKLLLGKLHKYFVVSFAGFLIASPLPTEIGVTMLASIKHVSILKFASIAYTLHFLGILVILAIGSSL